MSKGFVPDREFEFRSDDIQNIEQDPLKLAKKYIAPIDALKSIVRPIVSTSKDVDNGVVKVEINHERPLESRAHAFMRMIGFPVAASAQSFYNPGHDPTNSVSNTKKANTNQAFISADFKKMVDRRETDPEVSLHIFEQQNVSASVYSLLLATLVRPFQMLDESLGPFDVDKQQKEIELRKSQVDNFFAINDSFNKSEILLLAEILGANYTEVTHVLKPFVVDPAIDITVNPYKNRIAVPFLKDKDELKISERESVLRPGLELIIRERLRSSEAKDSAFLETAMQILNGEKIPTDSTIIEGSVTVSAQLLISTMRALLGKYDIDADSINELKPAGLTERQLGILKELVKTLKGLSKRLHTATRAVLTAIEHINWVVLPSTEGPEQGLAGAVINRNRISSWEKSLDKQIVQLKIDEINATHQVTAEKDLGNFASPFDVTINDENLSSIENNLHQLTQNRDKIAKDSLNALGDIELISGEVSGLGLVDILCTYIALWSLDEVSLISLLDDEAFDRLVTNFKALKVGAVEDRFNHGSAEMDIETALSNFETNFRNALAFFEYEFLRQTKNPGNTSGGDIHPDS